MRLIDADALSKSVLEWLPSDPCGRSEAEYPFETDICISMLQEIEDAPTIDAVEVVRCKDCYHAEDDITHMFCVYFHHKVYEDDYCSNAVQRKEESEGK